MWVVNPERRRKFSIESDMGCAALKAIFRFVKGQGGTFPFFGDPSADQPNAETNADTHNCQLHTYTDIYTHTAHIQCRHALSSYSSFHARPTSCAARLVQFSYSYQPPLLSHVVCARCFCPSPRRSRIDLHKTYLHKIWMEIPRRWQSMMNCPILWVRFVLVSIKRIVAYVALG